MDFVYIRTGRCFNTG